MKPKIALTFDDGPSGYTPRILDILERHNARASFFVVGNIVEAGADTIKRAVAMGSEVISHSWSHCKEPYLSQLAPDEIRKELLDTHAAIKGVTGFSSAMFRPPYGEVSDTLKDVAEELGLSIIMWSVDSWDWKSQNADSVYGEIFSNVSKENSVILCHDVHETTADAMERVIPDLLEEYELVTVSELMGHDGFTVGERVVYPLGEIKY